MAFVAIAELFLNGLHLLIQVVLALAALHLLLDPTANALFDLQQVDFGIQQRQYVLDTGRQVDDFENFLFLLDLQGHVCGHGIDQAPWLFDAVQRRQHFGRDFLAQLHVLLELRQQRAHEHFRLALGGVDFVDQGNFGTDVPFYFAETLHGAALLALDQHLDGAIGQFQQLQYGGNGTDAVQGVFARVIVGRVFLGQQENLLFARHRRLEGFDGLFAPHEQRDDHVRVNNDIAQWQKRQVEGGLHDFASTAALWPETGGNDAWT
ncbi:hypothetical protein D3C79_544030 [compost metagenome]